MKLNSYLLKSTIVAVLGALLFAFDTAVIAGTTRLLTETFHLTPAALGFSVSSALWGNNSGIPFVVFALMMLQFFVVPFAYPETKQVSLEQMQKKLGIA
jgi:hypothetical protein